MANRKENVRTRIEWLLTWVRAVCVCEWICSWRRTHGAEIKELSAVRFIMMVLLLRTLEPGVAIYCAHAEYRHTACSGTFGKLFASALRRRHSVAMVTATTTTARQCTCNAMPTRKRWEMRVHRGESCGWNGLEPLPWLRYVSLQWISHLFGWRCYALPYIVSDCRTKIVVCQPVYGNCALLPLCIEWPIENCTHSFDVMYFDYSFIYFFLLSFIWKNADGTCKVLSLPLHCHFEPAENCMRRK